MSINATPVRLDLKKNQRLEIEWQDGLVSVYSLDYLRSKCPCAACREQRGREARSRLTVLPGNFAGRIEVVSAELVGNYALRIEWSDDHGSGIYSFQYLRDIAPGA